MTAGMTSGTQDGLRGLVVTGTDTDVGKTYVTAGILREFSRRGLRAGVYKPACSGADVDPDTGKPRWSDLEILSRACALDVSLDQICPQRFLAPLAPPAAAARENREVDASLLVEGARQWQGKCDWLVVEGIGGWLCPMGDRKTFADLAKELGFPVLIVAANRLGMLNHSLLTADAVLRADLTLAGILVNDVTRIRDESMDTNVCTLRQFAPCPVFGPVPFDPGMSIQAGYFAQIDWASFCEPTQ